MPALIKWGILGLGKIAHKFASDLILVEDCELTAVASSNEDRAKVFAKEFGVNTFYGDYENEKTTGQNKFDLPEQGFEPQILEQVPAQNLNFEGG